MDFMTYIGDGNTVNSILGTNGGVADGNTIFSGSAVGGAKHMAAHTHLDHRVYDDNKNDDS
eukprot:8949399-Ditylum_brightwellii.AAC.1